jgi:hypothetical protein
MFQALLSSVGLPNVLSLVLIPIAVLIGTPARIALSARESKRLVDNTAPVALPALVNLIAFSFINGIIYEVIFASSHLL